MKVLSAHARRISSSPSIGTGITVGVTPAVVVAVAVTVIVTAVLVTISPVVIGWVAVNDRVAIGRRIRWRVGSVAFAVYDDDGLRLGGCGHAHYDSTQHRTSREHAENCLSHFNASCQNHAPISMRREKSELR